MAELANNSGIRFAPLDDLSAAAYVRFGAIVSCDDPAVISSLELIASDAQGWFDRVAGSIHAIVDSLDEFENEETFYQLAINETLQHYLVEFWKNGGDITSWLADVAAARGIILDNDRLNVSIRFADWESARFESTVDMVCDLLFRAVNAVEEQGFEIFLLWSSPDEAAFWGCVVSSDDADLLRQCDTQFAHGSLESWF